MNQHNTEAVNRTWILPTELQVSILTETGEMVQANILGFTEMILF